MPAAHREFFSESSALSAGRRYFMCACGDQSGPPSGGPVAEDMLWIREAFFAYPHDLPYTVVFGHTPQREVVLTSPIRLGLIPASSMAEN